MSDKDNFIEMGFCTKPHGIKGEFQFHLHNPENSSLKKKSLLKLTPSDETSSINKNGVEFKVKNIQFGNKIICSLEDVDNRNLVEQMIPFTFFISRDQFVEANDDEVFLSDLLGLTVVNESKDEILKIEKDLEIESHEKMPTPELSKSPELKSVDQLPETSYHKRKERAKRIQSPSQEKTLPYHETYTRRDKTSVRKKVLSAGNRLKSFPYKKNIFPFERARKK
jgi:16S rRNA processing protein RimM